MLAFCDRTQLTLPLGLRCRDHLPGWVRSRIDGNLANNAIRWRKTKAAYREAASAYQEEQLEFLVLKGFTHCPDFVAQPCHRAQYDIDLLFPREQLQQAREITLHLGYEPLNGFDKFPIDHLPTMIRKTGWEWRGDY
ncbi:MAG TPA: nucleotidyltransferase family protein, partial [Bryobacteraceae bacterium]|nr:nucleotidyltransferase family protein [Bryobacteraceae bacterium]